MLHVHQHFPPDAIIRDAGEQGEHLFAQTPTKEKKIAHTYTHTKLKVIVLSLEPPKNKNYKKNLCGVIVSKKSEGEDTGE